MDHIPLHTPGVSKRKRQKRQQQQHKFRYFSLEPIEDEALSGTELISRKKRIDTDECDVTKQLLGLMSKSSNNSKANSEKQFIVNGGVIEVSKNAESNLKSKSSISSHKNKEIDSKDDLWKKKRTNTEEAKRIENINLKRDSKLQHTLETNGHEDIRKKSNKPFLNDVPLSISPGCSKGIKKLMQDSVCKNDNQFKKTRKKHSFSRKKRTNENKKVEDETEPEISKTAKLYDAASVVDKIVSKHPNIAKETCVSRGDKNLSLSHKSETKMTDRSGTVRDNEGYLSQTLSKDIPETLSQNGFSFQTRIQNRISGEWNVQNCDRPPEKKITPRSKTEKQFTTNIAEDLCQGYSKGEKELMQDSVCKTDNQFKKTKKHSFSKEKNTYENKKVEDETEPKISKTAKLYDAASVVESHKILSKLGNSIGNSFSEQRTRTTAVERGRFSETEMEDHSSQFLVYENDKREEFMKETCNSQSIIVEMCGVYNVPSNPIHQKVSDFKKKNLKTTMFNLKSDVSWKTSKMCGSENWEVQYANTDNLPKIEIQNFENINERLTVEFEENETSFTKIDPHFEGESNYENTYNLYELFDISDSEAILALPPSYSLFFKGALKVKVLVGKINVLGHEISHTSQQYTVYSPFGVSLPGLQACAKQDASLSTENYWQQVENRLNQLKKERSWIKEKILHKVPEFSSIILLERASETLLPFLGKYLPTLRFPSAMAKSRPGEDASGTLRVLFVDRRSTEDKLYREPSAWDSIIQFLLKRESGKIRVMACGGKGVGKSTFLRFLSNKTLSKYKEVLYFDIDPGQCEFTIPGCVSAVIVKNPLLGPNFTHLTCPERMIYVGEVDITRCSTYYLQCVKDLFYWCLSQPHLFNMPWFINTMGFVRGLGVELMVMIIKFINPSDLIQINSSVQKRNYQFLLNRENVQDYVSSVQSVSHKEKDLSYAFHLVPSAAELPENRNSPWGVQANVARETVIMSYFSQVVAPPTFSLLEVAPFKLPFSGLKLCVTHEKIRFRDYLLAINANLVALCEANNVQSLRPSDPEYPEIVIKPPICQCVGFGIVRGVDLEKKVFFIITPIEPRKLKIVNCLVLGSVNLPDSVYTLQDEAQGSIPYVIEGDLLPLGREIRAAKSVIKLKK